MSEISIYDIVPTPKLADKLIGTSVGGTIPDVTYNFTLEELLQLFIPNIPANTLQGVLDYGNTATQDINLTGTINTTDLNVLATANILDSVLTGETHIEGELFDRLDSKGTAGQVLTSTGSGVEWYTIPTVIPTLQQVLQSGNTSNISIVLTANITAVTATASNVVSNTSLSVNGTLKDGTASAGSADQILSSTGSGVEWVDMPVYNAVSPLLYNSVTKTFSIQVANSSQGGYLSSADWINFDGKQDAIILTTSGTSGAATFVGNTLNIPVYTPDLSGYVPVSRTLTINGVTYDLSANRSWTIAAGVASVTATSPLFSSGGANPDISIQVANGGEDGYLSAADWNTFNNKQSALTFSSPLVNTAGVVSIPAATTSVSGYLTNTDWNTFNNKQNALDGGTGLVKSTAGTITYITDNSTNWNTAYNRSIVSAAVTGTTTKTLTLNEQDGNTITASWTDLDTGLTSVGLSMPSAFTVTNSPLTSNGTIGVTGAGTTAQYVRGDGSLATFPTIASEAQRLVTEVYNSTGATLTKGTVVYVNGGQGNLPTITKAIATGDSTSAQTYGVVQNDITNMNNGYVVVIGSLQNIDTQAYTNGEQLYLSSTTAGAWTSVKQYAPAHLVYVGIVIRSHPTQGVVEIRIQNGFEMDELHNVAAQNPNNNAILQYKTSTSLWTSVDGTTTNIAEGTNLYYLDSRARAALSFTAGSGAYNSTTGVITIPTNTNQLTNGASFITLSSLTASSPLSYNNTTGDFSISQSGASANGYLSSTDWNTFNSKQAAGDYITSLTGEATGTGPGATAVTLNNASVTGKVLTGVNITGGSVVATDTMLTAFGKLQNQINGLIGSTIYQGVWNANTNTPTLASGTGTRGYYYIVNVAGNTNLDGITDWQIGDWAIYDGTAWQKVDNTDAVTSVNGFTGAVSLTTDNIAQGTTNLYFANSLARTAVSLTTTGSSGAATYNNTTGIFNIPNYGTALANYLPLTGGTLTGALIIDPANTGVVGLDVASNTVTLRSDSTNPFSRQLTTTMGSGTLVKVQAAGFGGTYVTDLGFYTSSSSAVNTTPNLYLTGGNNRVGINTITPAQTLDVVGTAGVSGVLTLGSTISNGTYTYTLPGATGTLALVGGAGVGTVTSVAALTIGTTGTDLSSSVANSTTTPVITLNVPTASGTNRGALSSADWTTFNGKQNTITLTTTGTSGASTFDGSTLNIPQYQAAITNAITGTLTATKIPKATGANTIGDSIITDNGTYITVSAAAVDNYIASFINTDAGSNGVYVKADGAAFVTEPLSMVGGITLNASGSASFSGDITANKFIKSGGTSSQFLMADGSTSTGPSLTGYVPYTGATTTVDLGNQSLYSSSISVQAVTSLTAKATIKTISSGDPNWGFNTTSAAGAGSNQYHLRALGYGGSNGVLRQFQVVNSETSNTVHFAVNFDGTGAIFSSGLGLGGVMPTTDRQLYISGSSFTTGTSQYQAVINTTFVNAATDIYGLYLQNNTNVNVTASYSLYIPAMGGSGTIGSKWAIYQGGASEKNYFAGNVGIGTTSPTGTYGKLSVAGGISLLNDNNAKLEIGRYSSGTANSYIKLGASSNSLRFTNNDDTADLLYLTNGGNLGLGIAPSAWGSILKAFQLGNYGAYIAGRTDSGGISQVFVGANSYYDGANWVYTNSTFASRYYQADGAHNWQTSASGTSGGTITWTPAMTLSASGNLLINTTTDSGYKLDVNGTGRFSNYLRIEGSYLQVINATNPSVYINNTNVQWRSYLPSGTYNYAISDAVRDVLTLGYNGGNSYFQGCNVGIGTSSPNTRLEIASGNSSSTEIQRWSYNDGNAAYSLRLKQDVSSGLVKHIFDVVNNSTTYSNNLVLTNGNVGIGTTAPSGRLHIVNASGSGQPSLELEQQNSGSNILQWKGSAGTYLGVIQNNGNVGIGTTSPSYLLDVRGTSAVIQAKGTGTTGSTYSALLLGSPVVTWNILNDDAGPSGDLRFYNDSTSSDAIRVKRTNNNVLIGTTTDAGYKLEVNGNARATSFYANGGSYNTPNALVINNDVNWTFGCYSDNSTLYWMQVKFYGTGDDNRGFRVFNVNGNTVDFRVNGSGNGYFRGASYATAFYESSDKTIKTLIEDNHQAKGIESVVAKLYTKNGKEELGYFAQDVQGILPSAVIKGTDGLLSLSYREVHTAKIARLEKRVAELEEQLKLN